MQKQRLSFFVLLTLLTLFAAPSMTYAQELEDVSITHPSPPLKKLPQNTPSSYSNKSNNPILNSSDFRLLSPTFLQAEISSSFIDFGVIIPGEPLLRTQTLSVTPGAAFGADIIAFEDHAPTATEGAVIVPDTTCDNGSCTEHIATLWQEPLTYGFGYRCTPDNHLCQDFKEKETYKQFANIEKGKAPQILESLFTPTTLELIYKISIPPTAAGKKYQNTIYYIISPRY